MIIEASAPSNIALIKYMGKTDSLSNRPTNSSLSWTLKNLQTFVRLTEIDSMQDEWKALRSDQLSEINLNEKSKQRFLSHFAFLKQKLSIKGFYQIESANNFPSDCGLASSASSFAALTKAACALSQNEIAIHEMAELSRHGSGSSCRSFFAPWALWFSEGVRPMEFPIGELHHQVVVVESAKKLVSSSEAHLRVIHSDLFPGRPERAEKRLASLIEAFRSEDWRRAYEICWSEFWDMHALFETSEKPFGYMQKASIEVLNYIRQYWQTHADGPIVTMDAGANVHLLYRSNQAEMASKIRAELQPKFIIFS